MRIFCTGFTGYGDDNCKAIFELKVYDSGCQIEIPKDVETVEEWNELASAIKNCTVIRQKKWMYNMDILSIGFDGFDNDFNKVFEIRECDDGLSVQIIKYIETEDEWDNISCAVRKCITRMKVERG